MIKLTDRLYLEADSYQYILKEKKTIKDKKSKRQGETYYVDICYHSKLEPMCESILDKMTKKAVSENEGTLNDLVDALQDLSIRLMSQICKCEKTEQKGTRGL